MSENVRNIIAILLILISLGCLFPGLTQPMLQIQISAELPFVGKLEIFNQIQSIIDSIESLYQSENTLVAFLILLFSVVVPLMKATILIVALSVPGFKYRRHMYDFVALIGKWSMADVFVVAVFMAFLATGAHPAVSATLHEGFYFFTAYCVISILGIQVMKIPVKPTQSSAQAVN